MVAAKNKLLTETVLQFVTPVGLATCITSYSQKCKEHMCMLQGEVIQDEVQYWICIPSTVQTGIQSHICDFFFFFCISGYNDATDLSLGDIIDRMRNQKKKKKKGVKFSSVWNVQRSKLGVVFNKVRWTTYDALCYINLPALDASHDFPAAFIYWISCLDF